MKRYMVFAFNDWYPNGGLSDYIGLVDTPDEFVQLIAIQNRDYEVVHFIDLTTEIRYGCRLDFVNSSNPNKGDVNWYPKGLLTNNPGVDANLAEFPQEFLDAIAKRKGYNVLVRDW